MALAFRVSQPSDMAVVFAAHDIFLSVLTEARDGFPREEMAEVYTAPFAFMHGRFKRPDDEGGWMLFTPIVPWTHEVHHIAVEEMKRSIKISCSVEKSVENVQEILKHVEDTICIFPTHRGYPRINDIGPNLDERAVRFTCASMQWNVPKDWQERRTELTEQRGIPNIINVVDFIAGCNKENSDTESQQMIDNQMDVRDGETVHL